MWVSGRLSRGLFQRDHLLVSVALAELWTDSDRGGWSACRRTVLLRATHFFFPSVARDSLGGSLAVHYE